jgi:hypothetical protein
MQFSEDESPNVYRHFHVLPPIYIYIIQRLGCPVYYKAAIRR